MEAQANFSNRAMRLLRAVLQERQSDLLSIFLLMRLWTNCTALARACQRDVAGGYVDAVVRYGDGIESAPLDLHVNLNPTSS